MEFKAIGSVPMRGVFLEVFGQIDNVDCLKGAFFDANAASDAERFREVGDFGLGADFDAEFSKFDDRAGLFAFLLALFRFTFLGGDDGDSGQVIAGLF